MITKPILDCIVTPLSPKYLRLTVILLAVYKVVTAFVVLLLSLVALAYPEETKHIVQAGIGIGLKTQPTEREYKCVHTQHTNELGQTYDVWAYTYSKSPMLSRIDITYILYFCTTVIIIYVLSCLGLLIGTLRNRPKFFIPWLLADILGSMAILLLMMSVGCHDNNIEDDNKMEFLGFCLIIVCFHLTIWGLIREYYKKLVFKAKYREEPLMSTDPSGDGALTQVFLDTNDPKHVV